MYLCHAWKKYNNDLEESANSGKWPEFPEELTHIISFLFPGDEEDPEVVNCIDSCIWFIVALCFYSQDTKSHMNTWQMYRIGRCALIRNTQHDGKTPNHFI